jgi:hypothetical protein
MYKPAVPAREAASTHRFPSGRCDASPPILRLAHLGLVAIALFLSSRCGLICTYLQAVVSIRAGYWHPWRRGKSNILVLCGLTGWGETPNIRTGSFLLSWAWFDALVAVKTWVWFGLFYFPQVHGLAVNCVSFLFGLWMGIWTWAAFGDVWRLLGLFQWGWVCLMGANWWLSLYIFCCRC